MDICWVNEWIVSLKDVGAQYIFGTTIIKMNKIQAQAWNLLCDQKESGSLEAVIRKTNVKSVLDWLLDVGGGVLGRWEDGEAKENVVLLKTSQVSSLTF